MPGSTGRAEVLAADAILSTTFGGGYGYKQGTSMAGPHAAGVAALVRRNTGLNAEQSIQHPQARARHPRLP